MRLLVAGFLVLPLFAGCLSPADVPDVGAPISTDPRNTIFDVLNQIPAPEFDAVHAVDAWETFVWTHPKRDFGSPTNPMAAQWLRDRLERAGYETEILMLPFNDTIPNAQVRIVRGTLATNDTTHRLGLVAHYDGEAATIQAAYDDGAGTIAQLSICELLAENRAHLKHTVDCLFFDAEEMGLVASRAYVKAYQAQDEFHYDAVFGYDMTGINWPGHAWKLWTYVGVKKVDQDHLLSPTTDFLNITLRDFFDGVLPGAKEGIEVRAGNPRNSDEQSFSRIGIPAIRFAGGQKAADYPHYHMPTDTIPAVYEFVGGRANFEKGMDAVVRASYYTILGVDKFNPLALPTA